VAWIPGDQRNQASTVQPYRITTAEPECFVLSHHRVHWLYEGAAHTRRRWLKPVAILVPIFGGGTAALIWLFLLLAVAQLMGIA